MCTVPGCGTTSDTVNVVDLALPVGGFWPSSVNGNEITFNANYIQCTDTYIWNFGDSTGSTDQNPMHVYPDTGRYTVQLICCNRIGCDTFYYYLHIDSMSATANINVRNEISPGLTISPNPANDLLHIFIEPNSEEALLEAYNSNDQMIFRRKIKTSSQRTEFELNISDYADGIYLFRIISKSGVYCKKEIIHHNF